MRQPVRTIVKILIASLIVGLILKGFRSACACSSPAGIYVYELQNRVYSTLTTS